MHIRGRWCVIMNLEEWRKFLNSITNIEEQIKFSGRFSDT